MTYWNTYEQTALTNYPGQIDPSLAIDPRFCQLQAPTWDGDTTPGGENAGKNCGETCNTANIYFTTGVYISPDSLKGEILDPPGSTDKTVLGTTTIDQLRQQVRDIAQIDTTPVTPTTVSGTATGSLLNLVWYYTKIGLAVTELRWWDHPNSGYFHWATALGLDPTTVWVFDPYTGRIIQETYAQHSAMYVGAGVSGGGMFSYNRLRDPNL